MTKNSEQQYETYESLIKKTLLEINYALLKDTKWHYDVDIKKGLIRVISNLGASYLFACQLSEKEMLDILLGLKEKVRRV